MGFPLDPCRFNPATEWSVNQQTIGTSTTKVAPFDPCRISIAFSAIGMFGASGPINFAPSQAVLSNIVVALSTRGQFEHLKSEDYGGMIGESWFARSTAGSVPITVITARLAHPEMLSWEQQSSLLDQLSTLRVCVSDLSNSYAKAASKLQELLSALQLGNFSRPPTRELHSSLDSLIRERFVSP